MKQRTRLMHGGDDLMYNLSKKHDGGISGEIPLHKMKPQEHYIEAQVQEGDTLQAIALRFYCSVSELKRINHMHKENEIFARRTIKVPVTPYSVLTELIPAPQPEPSTSTHITTHNQVHNTQNGLPTVQNLDVKDDDCAIDCNAVVLNSTLAPAVVPYTDTEITETITEDTQLLPNKPRESVETVVVKQLTAHGADFGLKWFHLVCFMLFLGVIAPLLYLLLYLDTSEHIAHESGVHTTTTSTTTLSPFR